MTGNPSSREPMDVEASDTKLRLDKMWPWSRGQAEAEAAEVDESGPMDISLDRTLRSEEISELEASYKGEPKRRLPELPKTPEQAPSNFPTVFPTYPLPPLLFEKEKKEEEAERKYREKIKKAEIFNQKCEVRNKNLCCTNGCRLRE